MSRDHAATGFDLDSVTGFGAGATQCGRALLDELEALEILRRPARLVLDYRPKGLDGERVSTAVLCNGHAPAIWVIVALVRPCLRPCLADEIKTIALKGGD